MMLMLNDRKGNFHQRLERLSHLRNSNRSVARLTKRGSSAIKAGIHWEKLVKRCLWVRSLV